MADPLSVAGLAAGLVSLGLQVTGGLVSYVGAIRSRPEDLASANGYINSIRAAINHINSSSACAQASQTASDNIKFSVDACKDELKALEELIVKLSASQHGGTTVRGKIRDGSKKLTHAFHRADIKELEDRLSRAYTTLQGAMQALGLLVKAAVCVVRFADAEQRSPIFDERGSGSSQIRHRANPDERAKLGLRPAGRSVRRRYGGHTYPRDQGVHTCNRERCLENRAHDHRTYGQMGCPCR